MTTKVISSDDTHRQQKRDGEDGMLGRIARATAITAISIGLLHPTEAQQRTKGRVLVVLSNAEELELRDGKTYTTGVFLNEFVTPVRAILNAGYEPVFANFDGSPVHFDPHSVVPVYFGGSQTKLDEAKQFVDGLDGAKQPQTLASIRAEGVATFVGVIVPGGHAPLQDMITNSDVGAILSAFHAASLLSGLLSLHQLEVSEV